MKPRKSPILCAMLSQTVLWEHLVFEKHMIRHMESYDPCDTGFPEDAQAALVKSRFDTLQLLQAYDSILIYRMC